MQKTPKFKPLHKEQKRRSALPLGIWFFLFFVIFALSYFLSQNLLYLNIEGKKGKNKEFLIHSLYSAPKGNKIWLEVPWSPAWQELQVLDTIPPWNSNLFILSLMPLNDKVLAFKKAPSMPDTTISLGKGANSLGKFRELKDSILNKWPQAQFLDSGLIFVPELCAQTSLKDTLCLSSEIKVWQKLSF